MMGKKRKLGRKRTSKRNTRRNKRRPSAPKVNSWREVHEIQLNLPEKGGEQEIRISYDDQFINQVKSSPLWKQLVAQFGEEQAEKLFISALIEMSLEHKI